MRNAGGGRSGLLSLSCTDPLSNGLIHDGVGDEQLRGVGELVGVVVDEGSVANKQSIPHGAVEDVSEERGIERGMRLTTVDSGLNERDKRLAAGFDELGTPLLPEVRIELGFGHQRAH